MKKEEEGFSRKMFLWVLLPFGRWTFQNPLNSQFLGNTCCLNIKEEDFELCFTISRFTFWAAKHNQINQLLNVSEGIVILLYIKIQSGILEKLPPSDSHVTFCSQWRRSAFKLPLAWQNLLRGQRLETLHVSPQRAIYLLSAKRAWLFLVRSSLNHGFSNL